MTKENTASRRQFLGLGAGALLAAAANKPSFGFVRSAEALKNIGVQLYTVRDLMPKDMAGTLKAIADLGYKEVEVVGRNLDELVPALRRVGLKPVSQHILSHVVTGKPSPVGGANPETLDATIAAAKKHNIGYLVVSYLFPQERGGGADFYRSFAEQMNRAGERCRAAGLSLCYHNHSFEFAAVGDTTPFDILIKGFDPRYVNLELDVFWVAMGGHDPARMLRQYKGRVPLVHLKDRAANVGPETSEAKVPATAFAEVGSGSLNFAEILRAAKESGVKHYFVEQDRTPGNPLDSLRQSYTYLSKLSF